MQLSYNLLLLAAANVYRTNVCISKTSGEIFSYEMIDGNLFISPIGATDSNAVFEKQQDKYYFFDYQRNKALNGGTLEVQNTSNVGIIEVQKTSQKPPKYLIRNGSAIQFNARTILQLKSINEVNEDLKAVYKRFESAVLRNLSNQPSPKAMKTTIKRYRDFLKFTEKNSKADILSFVEVKINQVNKSTDSIMQKRGEAEVAKTRSEFIKAERRGKSKILRLFAIYGSAAILILSIAIGGFFYALPYLQNGVKKFSQIETAAKPKPKAHFWKGDKFKRLIADFKKAGNTINERQKAAALIALNQRACTYWEAREVLIKIINK